MFVCHHESGWVVHAPAKINLALEVLGRRNDGYHQVETLLTSVRWFDSLLFTAGDTLSLSVRNCESPSPPSSSPTPSAALVPADESNLVIRAVRLLATEAGCPATGHITLHKRIPVQAGLGGGSSDAAAALVAANLAWGLGYSGAKLMQLAADIGTDVPFFLASGPAIGRDRGQELTRVALPSGIPLVLVKPPVGLSTPEVFAALDLQPGDRVDGAGGKCEALAAALQRHSPMNHWRGWIHNALEPAARRLSPWIEKIRHTMDRLPVVAHQMTGSGSGYFAVCRTWREATRVAARLRAQNWHNVCATRTCP